MRKNKNIDGDSFSPKHFELSHLSEIHDPRMMLANEQ